MSRDGFLAELEQRAPVLTDASVRAAATDRSGLLPATSPFAVVAATGVEHVVATLDLAHQHRVGVVALAVARIGEIAAEHRVPIFVLAHAGDGNLHPIVLTDAGPRDPLPAAVVAAADAVFALALELGGSVSGEHGVGLLKREWARRQLGPEAVALAERIRSVFDPHGILNPGKFL